MANKSASFRTELLAADDATIDDAIAYADPMVLRGLVYQFTGDPEVAATGVKVVQVGYQDVYQPASEADIALLRRKADGIVGKHLAVADAQRLDPALLPEREPDEKSQFREFRHAEMVVQLFPERIVGDIRVPDDGAGVGERHFFALGELARRGELQQFVVLVFGQSFPSSLDGSLYASILAVDGL